MLKEINSLIAATARKITGKIPKENKVKIDTLQSSKDLNILLKTDYSQAFENFKQEKCIFRGVTLQASKKFFHYSVVTPGLKVSENATYNLYTRLFSGILPSWNNFPRRNRSFICSSSINKALQYSGSYDNIYAVFPKNNSKIGVCPESDIWISFKNINETLDQFQIKFMLALEWISILIGKIEDSNNKKINNKFNKYYNYTQYLLKALNYESNKTVVSMLNYMSKKLNEHKDSIAKRIHHEYNKYTNREKEEAHLVLSLLRSLEEQGNVNLISFLDRTLDPIENNFEVVNVNDYNITSRISDVYLNADGLEVWTDSTCLFISLNYLQKNYNSW